MLINFDGRLTGNGLNAVPVRGDMTSAGEGTIDRLLGRFAWQDTRQLTEGQLYRLDLSDGWFYEILIESVQPGLVRFVTVS
jgi:hypothetical protein